MHVGEKTKEKGKKELVYRRARLATTFIDPFTFV